MNDTIPKQRLKEFLESMKNDIQGFIDELEEEE